MTDKNATVEKLGEEKDDFERQVVEYEKELHELENQLCDTTKTPLEKDCIQELIIHYTKLLEAKKTLLANLSLGLFKMRQVISKYEQTGKDIEKKVLETSKNGDKK